MSEERGVPVFVYGTLRVGDCRHGIKALVQVLHPEAYLPGFQMLHLGGFPGIVPGEGRVRGEIHIYDDFSSLDQIEGYRPADPASSLYLREEVQAEVPGEAGPVEVSTYIFNRRDRLGSGWTAEVIESGDWFSNWDRR